MSKTPARDQIHSAIIAALRQQREKLGMSKTRVAEKSGLSLAMISFVERDLRRPTLDTLLRIADALDVELWKLLKKATETVGR